MANAVLQIDPKTSARLGRVRQKDTAPELAVRRIANGMGMRYRLRNRDLPGSPDLANRSQGWAIFVHGCFWHRHSGCLRATTPKRNRAFWQAKFGANRARDQRVRSELRKMGFRTVVVWECETSSRAAVRKRLARLIPSS